MFKKITVGWLFKKSSSCGISFYSERYAKAVEHFVNVVYIEPSAVLLNEKNAVASLNKCDMVHVQYETSLFFYENRDCYISLCNLISCPIVVSLHEVYDDFPGVYPRRLIKGFLPFRLLREFIYDFRHPLQKALDRHISNNFYARKIFVHSCFQKRILINKGITPGLIEIIPFPVADFRTNRRTFMKDGIVRIGVTGFMNDAYDFDLLLQSLALCKIQWTFTWIGCVRRPEDGHLLDKVIKDVSDRNWTDRFTFTGQISEDSRNELLNALDIYPALFKYKSSSESLNLAIGARKYIVASKIPLTEEMNAVFPVLNLVKPVAADVASAIDNMVQSPDVRSGLDAAMTMYCSRFGLRNISGQLAAEYERLVEA
jgi:glycosyltransferase involved in cell wall biosynthesis